MPNYFYVQDQGVFIPTNDLAQAFAALNFVQTNSLGVGTDTLIPTVNVSNPNWIADIRTQDLWGYVGVGETASIYRLTKVGIGIDNPVSTLDITGSLHATEEVDFDSTLNVDGDTTITSTTPSTDKDTGALIVDGGVGIEENLNVGNDVTISGTTSSTSKDTGALIVDGGVGIEENLNVGGDTVIDGTLELNSSLIDVNNSTATGKFDYRLSSVGTGVSWRPPGVQTQNAIWVTMDGNDSNTGYLEGDAKRTIGAAAAIAQDGDTIFVRSGVYFENNPIGLRTDVSVSGQDLRLVTIVPNNVTKDVFHVRRGCLIENLNFSGSNISIAHTGAAAVAFPPTNPSDYAVSGYIAPGPANEGPSGRWRSPYIRNCTNFMTKSIGMKIDGNHATAATIGNDLKCMVCDSFTQYNEAGIGVSITNNGYAQLVSIFTINCDIGIYADTGGSCDLTNSNSSFGNFGLVAVGLGSTEFTGTVGTYPSSRTQPGVDPGSDKVTFVNVSDEFANPRRPYDGQALFFKINLDNYPDAQGTGILQSPMNDIQEIKILNGGAGYSSVSPPTIIIRDSNDLSEQPKGPQGIIAEVSPTIDEVSGTITAIDVVNSGRNYLPTQQLEVFIDGAETTGAAATVVTRPIYYTVDVATDPTDPIGRFSDAAYLIEKNLDFIAAEAMDRTYYNYPSFSVPGLGTSRCITDIKIILKAINHNLVFGGNDRVYDAAKFYVDNAVLAGEEQESIYAYGTIVGIATQIIRNETVTKIGGTSPYNIIPNNTFTQFKDNSIIVDPSNPPCANVASAIQTFVGIITTGIGSPAAFALIPRTIGNTVGITTVTFNEFIPYELFGGEEVSLKRISRILTSSHSFEYIGTGTDINTSTPFKGGVPIKENEIVALDGAQIPFTSTDQKGNFDIGEGFQINQPSAVIRGRDFSKAIQAEVTPLILALR